MSSLTPAVRKFVIQISLAVLYVADEAHPVRQRSTGARMHLANFNQFVGRMCKGSIEGWFRVSLSIAARYEEQVRPGGLVRVSRSNIG